MKESFPMPLNKMTPISLKFENEFTLKTLWRTLFRGWVLIPLFYGLLLSSAFPIDKSPFRWVTYYSNKAPLEAFKPYQLCVFDSTEHPPLMALKQANKTLLGYISLGEVEQYRSHFKEVKKEGILLDENPNWKGSFFVDLRNALWVKRVVEELVPAILQKGFDGIFMDTLDNAETLEERDPIKYEGMKQAAIDLVKAIRQNYPQIKIMMNRGFQLLPQLTSVIDMEMGEVIYTQYDFQKKKYLLQPLEEHKYYVKTLKEAQKANPSLKVFTLDYWDKTKTQEISNIYKKQREDGFIPYVATIKLNEIIPEPGENHAKKSG